MVSARARRGMVDYAVSRGASIRHACALLQVSRSTLGYTSRLEARDAELAPMLQEIAFRHRGYGYRFAWALLRRQGQIVNHKRVRRIWRSLGLTWCRRKKSRKIRTGKTRVLAPTGPNQVWAYDFIHDRCGNGQSLKILTVIDEWTRECVAVEVAASIDAARVIVVLERAMSRYGIPQTLRSDNGPEFIARALRIWALFKQSDIATIDPGKPWQNGSAESFHATFRRECLDGEWFAHRREAAILIEQWRREYNRERPHSSLGYRTPAEVGAESRGPFTVPQTEHVSQPLTHEILS
jgi:putative transposase